MGASDLLQKSSVPEGELGNWRVERFEVDKSGADLFNLRQTLQGTGSRYILPGTYTRLVRGRSTTVMSDTRAELDDHWEIVYKAKDHVLIHGLGLGIVAQACLRKPEVTHVTVIEKSGDVIDLVAPHIADDRLTVLHADALTWKPPKGQRYGAVWHDIWDDICGDNLEQMRFLHRRYGRRTDWQGSWCHKECIRHRSY